MTIEVTVDAIAKYEKGIVVVERAKEPYGLALPGGSVKEGENLETAVRRELKEETNLGVSGLEQFQTYYDPYRDPRGTALSTVYVCNAYGKLKPGSDAKSAKIISLDQIDALKNEFAFDHYQILSDYRNSLAIKLKLSKGQNSVWQIHYMSEYYDSDPRMPGIVPINERLYFVASSRQEALDKAYKVKPKWKKLKGDEKINVSEIPLENLVIARDSKDDGRLGFYSTQNLKEVQLSSSDDKKLYTLGVALLPKGKD